MHLKKMPPANDFSTLAVIINKLPLCANHIMSIDDYYEQQGGGPTIVFIHGSFATTASWKKYIGQLANHYLCISIKLPGHGGAPDPGDFAAPSAQTETRIIAQVIKQFTDQPVHVVGHSYGAVIALNLALEGEVKVAKLSLFEPVAVSLLNNFNARKEFQQVHNFLLDYRQAVNNNEAHACSKLIDFWAGANSYAQLPAFIKNSMVPLTANNLRHWDICMNNAYPLNNFKKLTATTQVICGDLSNPILHTIATTLSHHISDCSQTTITGASHFLVTSHSQQCLELLAAKKP